MAEKFVINGGKALNGTVEISGAKNAAVAILPATVLSEGICVIENLPRIADVFIVLKIIKNLGAKVKLDENGTATIDTTEINGHVVDKELAERMRASYYFLGALLGRCGEAEVAMPGGCVIGQRPIDLHKKGLRALGATIETDFGKMTAHADELVGKDIYLDQVSVGATINIMLAAVKAKGNTTIVNAAKEPHVVDVANFLNCMGAKIKGAGTDIIKIRGVEKLHGCTYAVIPDQIETGTLMIAAAATQGDVTVQNVIPTHMGGAFSKALGDGRVCRRRRRLYQGKGKREIGALSISRHWPYPGFPTDLQQPMTVLLSTANGTSVIVENIFEARFKHIDEIRRMGAKVTIDDRIAVVNGVDRLTGAPVKATDLRAGAALIIAGLMAEGTTEIFNIKYIERGYDHIDDKLVKLGADIIRVKEEPKAEENFETEFK